MPVTQAEHDKKLKVPAVCELLPLRDLPIGDNIMVRTNGAFVAGYELRGILAYFATDDDALGQENLKTTLIADQGADVILQTANQMENQVAVSTPGSNPFLTAQAQVANLRCQAYIQKMLAAELRQEAGRIAHDNVLLKRRTTATGGINSLITGALTAP